MFELVFRILEDAWNILKLLEADQLLFSFDSSYSEVFSQAISHDPLEVSRGFMRAFENQLEFLFILFLFQFFRGVLERPLVPTSMPSS